MIVVDASAVLEVLLRSPAALTVEARLFDGGEALHAPHLLDLEVAQVIRRHAMSGAIGVARGRQALAYYGDIPLQRWPHLILLPRIWALRATLTVYDASYVALAEALDATVLTRDARMARASGHRARVELV